jgi:FkbM family methyltransferase
MQALGPERILDFTAFDTPLRMHLPYAATDAVQRIILLSNGLFETHQLAALRPMVAPGSVVVDAGANIGNHTLFFAKICRAAQVHAFEPLRTVFPILERNVVLNGLANVACHNVALGAASGRASLAHFATHNLGASQFRLGEGDDYPMVALDELALDRLDVLKIDVEGSQLAVLEGGRATIDRHRPLIWIEFRPVAEELDPGDALLRAMGYRQLRALTRADFLYVADR